MGNSCFFIVVVALLLLLKCTTLCLGRNFLNSTTDQDALLAFKINITPDSYGILAKNWSTDTSVCYWIGVSCGIKHRRVTALNLSDFHLRGTVAPHLGNLTFLRSLDISSNNFAGIIPDELSNLRLLKEINVGFNFFTGEVPSWLGTLPELQHIHLNNNTFMGKIPPSLFNTTSKLQTLNLQYNQFTADSMPYRIFKMSSIRDINLMGCSLSGTLPSDMCNNTPKLKTLSLSVNQLYGKIPPTICKCRDLEELSLSYNHFDGNIPSEIGSLVNLKIIDLGNNSFRGGIPKELGNLTSLISLDLPYNKLSGELPQELSNLAYLEEFVVGNNALSGSIPPFMFNISTLKIMDLSSNHFSDSLPSTIGMGLSLFNLEELYLGENRLMGPIPNYITNASKLTNLGMYMNSFSGPVPSFGNLRLLQELRIWENNLTGDLGFLSSLANCRYLQLLEISTNSFNGVLPTSIGNLSTSLHDFHAAECDITGAIPPEIGNLINLQILALDSNQLTGELPQELSNLAYLEEFYISNNALSGSIPPFMFNISTLKIMSLGTNHFSGNLPLTIGMGLSLFNLEELYLGENRLTGPIPNYITNASKLTNLGMYMNSFSGPVPNFGNLRLLQELRIWENNLTGDLRFLSSLANCRYLQLLEISTNSFNGVLPTSIGNLSTSLHDFHAAECDITGAIPPEIGNLISLKILALDSNQLTGDVTSDMCNNIPKLKTLDLLRNQLYGEIPPNIYKCRDIEELRLSFNHFNGNQGELPEELSNLAYLEEFNVGNNALSGSIPSFMFNISTLKIMSLRSNQFSGSLPSTIGMELSLLSLEEIYLSDNRLMGPIPNYITNASKLTQLEMLKNSFSGPVPSFGNLRLLQILRIWENNLTGDLRFLSSLTNCRYLQVLDISINPLSGILPTSIGNLSTSLQDFLADECKITGVIPPEIGNLISLQILTLNSNKLTGLIPTTLGKLEQLQGISLYNNRLQGYIPRDLCQMSNLVNLYLHGNMLTGPIPECFGELKSLREVYLGSNNLNSTIPSNFWNLVDLLTLNLSSNNLSGQLSSDIGSFEVIISLDLSLNQFSGDIPSSIGSTQTIEFLSLAHNKFESSIPKSLGNIINLECLDLSNNNLFGAIPKSLEGLRYLRYFNVSYNKLEGEIPTGGPFVNFTAQSFFQNSALCGATRFHVPLCVQTRMRSKPKNVSIFLVKYILPPIISTIIPVIIIIVLIKRRKQNKVRPPADISLGTAWRRISYEELVRGTSAFSETKLLGRGGFGSVFRGILSDDGLNVAIKVFNVQLEGASKSFDTECEILSSVRHRNLVRIIGCCCNTHFKALILAYMPNGSLEKWLYSESYCLDMQQRLNIAVDVALALEYLHHGHTFPVVHCDIKPSNILLNEDMTAHVADFGLSKLFDEGEVVIQTNTLATIGYTAPEYGLEGKVSTNGDVYSYGILLLEMFTRKKPTDDMFSEKMSLKDWVSEPLLQQNTLNEIVAPGLLTSEDRHFSAKEECVSSIFGLAMECLAFSPEERINTIQIVAELQKIKTRFLASNKLR